MRRFTQYALAFIIALQIVFVAPVRAQDMQANAQAEEEHGFKGEFKAFHDILHPLQHDAVPQNDMKTIRARSGELYNAGMKIVRMPKANNSAEYKSQLTKFRRALQSYRSLARKGSDAKLKSAFAQVHDTFEELAAMQRR